MKAMHLAIWALIFGFGGIGGSLGTYFAIESTATYTIIATDTEVNAQTCAADLQQLVKLSGGKPISVGAGASDSSEIPNKHDCYAIVKHGSF